MENEFQKKERINQEKQEIQEIGAKTEKDKENPQFDSKGKTQGRSSAVATEMMCGGRRQREGLGSGRGVRGWILRK